MRSLLKACYLYITILIILSACTDSTESKVSFYHWKYNAEHNSGMASALRHPRIDNTIYMHYFDVDKTEKGVYPVYVLNDVDSAFKAYNIVPVVFVTNRSLQQEGIHIEQLSDQILSLVNEIGLHHFGSEHKTIQLDCDWSETTRDKYFQLIRSLNQHLEVVPTIRLHQIKYKTQTGVPPISHGVLMLYNMGDLKNEQQNSIIQADIVDDYIESHTTYPLTLDVALPLFSQTVIKNNRGQVRLVNRSMPEALKEDSLHFRQLDNHLFEVTRDTLYHGFYLSKGYRLKLEESGVEEILDAYSIVRDSKLKLNNVILYHLDDDVLIQVDLAKLLEKI
ncbi:hypothetical protein JMN32_19895 [Fulvivirga sp. 29W222]|uniref:NodB homology domain-containing protein n=1 Tax=Fulvivirga marina TaxID=2494733 RepID=A0A937FYP2_9BACT|nr:hypothetical protein [Fulvivirga marina]MBL6448584.1 hypothetical protein [Fulvivirga marina]